jgi:hypothetical protein
MFLFLLLIPTQLGKHFWPEWSTVLGIRSDYLSPTLYLVDLVWMGLMVVKILKSKNLNSKKLFTFGNMVLVMMVGVNVLLATNRWVAIYRWARIGQWLVTLKLITNYKLRITNYLKIIIPIWVLVESLLGLAQVINGGSMGGIFYWIGERRFSFSTLGIAQMNLFGEGLIRSYGSFSHPNSLAGFLLVCFWWHIYKNKSKTVWYWIVYWLAILGIFVSGSRWVWMLTLLMIFLNRKRKSLKETVGELLLGIGLMIVGLGIISNNYRIKDFLSGWDSDGLNKRWSLMVASGKMIKSSPLFGVGAGNFIVNLPNYQQNNRFFWWQPVHNIGLLAMSEIGILGIGALGLLIFKITPVERLKKEGIVLIGLILLTGMMDHYWLTLPQNTWLVVVMISQIPFKKRVK